MSVLANPVEGIERWAGSAIRGLFFGENTRFLNASPSAMSFPRWLRRCPHPALGWLVNLKSGIMLSCLFPPPPPHPTVPARAGELSAAEVDGLDGAGARCKDIHNNERAAACPQPNLFPRGIHLWPTLSSTTSF